MDYTTVTNLVGAFQDRWPQCFSVYERRRRPLKIGIHLDIEAAGSITSEEIRAALGFYCSNTSYLRACREGADRIGLDGSPAGSVSADHAARCARLLTYRLAKAVAKKAPAAPPSPPPQQQRRLMSLADLRIAAAEQRRAESTEAMVSP